MQALGLLALCLTVGDLTAFSGLPSHAESMRAWHAWIPNAQRADANLKQVWAIGGTYRLINEDKALFLFEESIVYRNWWGHAADAVNLNYGLRCRREHATEARDIHDWQLWGLPPSAPFWRLPRP